MSFRRHVRGKLAEILWLNESKSCFTEEVTGVVRLEPLPYVFLVYSTQLCFTMETCFLPTSFVGGLLKNKKIWPECAI